jgi:hypothetical protein
MLWAERRRRRRRRNTVRKPFEEVAGSTKIFCMSACGDDFNIYKINPPMKW